MSPRLVCFLFFLPNFTRASQVFVGEVYAGRRYSILASNWIPDTLRYAGVVYKVYIYPQCLYNSLTAMFWKQYFSSRSFFSFSSLSFFLIFVSLWTCEEVFVCATFFTAYRVAEQTALLQLRVICAKITRWLCSASRKVTTCPVVSKRGWWVGVAQIALWNCSDLEKLSQANMTCIKTSMTNLDLSLNCCFAPGRVRLSM